MADVKALLAKLAISEANAGAADARAKAAEARLAVVEQGRGRPVEKSVEKPGKKFFCPTALAGQTCTNKKCINGKLLHPEHPDWTEVGAEEAKSKILLARGRSQSPSGKRRSSRSRSRSHSPGARARAKAEKQRAYQAGLRAGAAAK